MTISMPGDEHELEAERIADHVMRMPDPVLQRCVCGGTCSGCNEESDATSTLDRNIASPNSSERSALPASFHMPRSAGEQLESGARSFMETRFQHDFSHVRVHTGSDASASAHGVNAKAYTVGHDIVFGAGEYSPSTNAGRRLLAHELTHVIQQRSNAVHPALMRSVLFASTIGICHQLLESRKFTVSKGGLIVSINALWEGPDEGAASCETHRASPYHVTLQKVDTVFDDAYGSCDFAPGALSSRAWAGLPAGDYYLTIWTNNTNPHCCLKGAIQVREEAGVIPSCTEAPGLEEADVPDQFQYDSRLEPELRKRFNRMVASFKGRGIGYGGITDLREKPTAHIVSTAHHIHTRKEIPLRTLQSLAKGKDLDGNRWYDKEWEIVPSWNPFSEPEKETDAAIMEKARENAYELAKDQDSDYVKETEVHCAYEGYPEGDSRRAPNGHIVPVSPHVSGKAIDLGGVEWEKLKGNWSPDAIAFVASFGLSRPFTPDSGMHCKDERWHFELGSKAANKTPAKGK